MVEILINHIRYPTTHNIREYLKINRSMHEMIFMFLSRYCQMYSFTHIVVSYNIVFIKYFCSRQGKKTWTSKPLRCISIPLIRYSSICSGKCMINWRCKASRIDSVSALIKGLVLILRRATTLIESSIPMTSNRFVFRCGWLILPTLLKLPKARNARVAFTVNKAI